MLCPQGLLVILSIALIMNTPLNTPTAEFLNSPPIASTRYQLHLRDASFSTTHRAGNPRANYASELDLFMGNYKKNEKDTCQT